MQHMTLLQNLIEEGGGIWVGIQEYEGVSYSLALFNSPKTGSTLALKTSEILSDVVAAPELVREYIAASDEKFGIQRSTILSVQEKTQ